MPVVPAVPSIEPEVGDLTVALKELKSVVPLFTQALNPFPAVTADGRFRVETAGVPMLTTVVTKFVDDSVNGEEPVTVTTVGAMLLPLPQSVPVPDTTPDVLTCRH